MAISGVRPHTGPAIAVYHLRHTRPTWRGLSGFPGTHRGSFPLPNCLTAPSPSARHHMLQEPQNQRQESAPVPEIPGIPRAPYPTGVCATSKLPCKPFIGRPDTAYAAP
jgi:hypothetical protein